MAFRKAKALQEAEKSVAQGKIAQAIKQYQVILENDPSDLTLLNTVGDLYIRDRNITEGLRQFHRLAEAYVREGFNVKAIAIYRKISKVDPNSIETLLKLADLYQQQGLGREAREQYLQVVDFYRKRNQSDRVLEVLHKLVQIDPENLNFRNRLAAEYDSAGKTSEAAAVFLESAEISLRREDQAGADQLLRKAAELDPKNAKVQLLRARVAVARNQPAEAESIINSSPELQHDPAGKRILFDSYITQRKIPDAAQLAVEVFNSNTSDFTPISTVSWLLAETGKIDEAYQLVESVSQSLTGMGHSGTLLDILHQIRAKAPEHIPTLELMQHLCERTGNIAALPEIWEALGHAYEQAGSLEQAETAYRKLAEREPDEQKFLDLLNGVRRKQGKEIASPDFTSIPLPMEQVGEDIPAEPFVVDADQESTVKEALENSDLFARYNLAEKAIAELEKVLQIYPDQVEVHRRILEISRKGFPERGAKAAGQLARIFRSRGEEELAAKYEEIAQDIGSLQEIPPMPPPSALAEGAVAPPAAVPAPDSASPPEFSLSDVGMDDSVGSSTPPPGEINLGALPWEDSGSPSVQVPSPPAPISHPPVEVDLSDDLEALARMIPEEPAVEVADPDSPPPAIEVLEEEEYKIHADSLNSPPVEVPAEASAVDSTPVPDLAAVAAELEDGKVEVDFYLENDFFDEARQTIARLVGKFPGSPLIAELRRKVEERAAEPVTHPEQTVQEDVPTPPAGEMPAAESNALVEEIATPPAAEPPPETVPVPPGDEHPAPTPAPLQGDVLGDLVGDLDASLEGFAPAKPPPAPPAPIPVAERASEVAPPEVAPPDDEPVLVPSPLSGLLAGMDEPLVLAYNQDDPETHYNLGVAFREMGLLDESIGEFQKVVRGAGKGTYPPNFLQACSLLAICFMEKKMPALAVRWYKRALETPDLDEEALLALQYDLGVAYEQAGDARNALERYTEVYSQNIDFRDVAEKVRELHHKV